jgi:hypothetical protein
MAVNGGGGGGGGRMTEPATARLDKRRDEERIYQL